MVRKVKPEVILHSWRNLTTHLVVADAKEVQELLDYEMSHGKRRFMAIRLHTRLHRLLAKESLEKLEKELHKAEKKKKPKSKK